MEMTPAQRNEKCREDEGMEEGGVTGKWEKRRARESKKPQGRFRKTDNRLNKMRKNSRLKQND